ncbi:MAG: amidohydrolase [Bacteroidota bacterium]
MAGELKIALVQSQLLWENPIANRALFSRKINMLSSHTDVVVLPEMFTTAFTMDPQHIEVSEGISTVEWMKEMATKKDVAIVGSIIFFEKGNYYNRLYFVDPNGKVDHYDKRHTFTLAGEHKVYQAGEEKVVVTYNGFDFYPLICYDLRFPVWSRNIDDYDVLIYVANWPKQRISAWDTLLKARAIENMAYCVGVNRIGSDGLGHEYPGHSAVYDVMGNRLAYSEKEEVLYVTLSKDHIMTNRTKLKFLQDRDMFSLR